MVGRHGATPRPQTFAATERWIDRRIAAYVRLATEQAWPPLDNAAAAEVVDHVVATFLAELDAPPRAPDDVLCRGYYAALTRRARPPCGDLQTLLRSLILATLFPVATPPGLLETLLAVPGQIPREENGIDAATHESA